MPFQPVGGGWRVDPEVEDGAPPDEPTDGGGPEPPPWVTLDGDIVQIPPYGVTRVLCPGGCRLQPRRRNTLRSLGRLVRGASRIGSVRSRSGRRYPVFRARSASRPFRIVTRRRGLRHEIVFVGPETGRAEVEEQERSPTAALRTAARAAFFRVYPRLRDRGIEVHHRIPLEWRHLFPKADPNRISNLQGLGSRDHLRKATDLWTAFRNAHRWAGRPVTPMDVLRHAALVDRSLTLPYPL